ncbi:hypothetical protein Q8A67_019131 [Cirrhinus molitorella]|uniref:Uncharacterized protein n=1 Tax=Cirrhinus molitorella TaxID=172907 RepID=A0AA88P6M1_9TELE|nr:hypothetical protein Q8A67_019131 [Cirrhinus molitorella]
MEHAATMCPPELQYRKKCWGSHLHHLAGVRCERESKRKGAGPGLCSADGTYLSTLAVNRAEATLFTALSHLVTAKHSHQPDDDTLPLYFCKSTKL